MGTVTKLPRLVVGLTAMLVLGTACKTKLSAKQRAAAEADLANARQLSQQMDAKWQAAMKRATDVVASGAPGSCRRPDGVAQLGAEQASAFGQFAMTDIVRPPDSGKPSPRFQMRQAEIQRLTSDLDLVGETGGPSAKDVLDRVKRLADPSWWTWELVILADNKDIPIVDEAEGTFVPGRIFGRSLLYDYTTDRIACMGVFNATNSEEVMQTVQVGAGAPTDYGAGLTVDQDLDRRAIEAGIAALTPVEAPTAQPE